MARLPKPGGDNNIWGDVLNDFLNVEHAADGSLRIRSDGTFYHKPAGGIPGSDLTSGAQSALNKAASSVQTVNGHAPDSGGAVLVAKSDIGLGNVDNTADIDKPISTATQTALDTKVNDGDVIALAVAL